MVGRIIGGTILIIIGIVIIAITNNVFASILLFLPGIIMIIKGLVKYSKD